MRRYRIFSRGLFLLALLGVLVGLLPQTASAATFKSGLIMDDSVMNNSNSMNVSQIDAFLNTFPNSCISTSKGFTAIDPTGYNPRDGFLYGGNVSAGKVIYDAAQAYNIDPRVLIVTLQKEQSLINGGAGCTTNRYAKALGYGCPDGGGSYDYSGVNLYTLNGTTYTTVSGVCVNDVSKVGFSQQIIHAAWLLKYSQQRSLGNIGWAIIKPGWDNSDDLNATYSGYMTQGCFKRSKYESACTNYDGYITIDNTAVHLDSGATAALYRYTPHFSGNQNFFNIFINWFGATTGPDYASSFNSFTLYRDSAHTSSIPLVANKYVLTPNQVVYAVTEVQNIGRATWDSNTHIGTASPRDHVSVFANTDWLASQRPAGLSLSSVAPNISATATFTMKAPSQAGGYRETFGLVDDGKVWTDATHALNIDVTTSTSAPVGYTGNILDSATTSNILNAGDSMISPDTYTSLSLSKAGELTLRTDFQKVWSPGVKAGLGAKLAVQIDGNLVLYTRDMQPVWNTETNGRGNVKLYVQEDGNLVLYNSGGPIWSSQTNLPLMHYDYTYSSLGPSSFMYVGQRAETADRNYKLILQGDGNLVLYNKDMRPLWATYSLGSNAGAFLVMQGDGNLVLYTKDMRPVWASGTDGKPGATFYVQPDGNLVVYSTGGSPLWNSGTHNR